MRRFVTKQEDLFNEDDHIVEIRWSEMKTMMRKNFLTGMILGSVPFIIFGLFYV